MTKKLLKLAALAYVAQAMVGVIAGTVAAWATPEGKHALAILRSAIGIEAR